jgi:hypothetical protein
MIVAIECLPPSKAWHVNPTRAAVAICAWPPTVTKNDPSILEVARALARQAAREDHEREHESSD